MASSADEALVAELRQSIERISSGVREKLNGLLDMAAWRAAWLVRVCGLSKEQAVRCAVRAVI